MSESSDHNHIRTFSERRLLTIMLIVSIVSVAVSLWFGDWRVTGGLFLGCFLSIVNFKWSSDSLKAMFDKNINSPKPKFSGAGYLFRYIIFALIIGGAYFLDLISIVAALIGFLNFITAIFIAAFIQLFFVLFKREEI